MEAERETQGQIGFLCFRNSGSNGHQSEMAGAFWVEMEKLLQGAEHNIFLGDKDTVNENELRLTKII